MGNGRGLTRAGCPHAGMRETLHSEGCDPQPATVAGRQPVPCPLFSRTVQLDKSFLFFPLDSRALLITLVCSSNDELVSSKFILFLLTHCTYKEETKPMDAYLHTFLCTQGLCHGKVP